MCAACCGVAPCSATNPRRSLAQHTQHGRHTTYHHARCCCSHTSLRLQQPEAALDALRTLHAALPDVAGPEVLHCLALAHSEAGDAAQALKWLSLLAGVAPGDAGVQCKLGALYHRCVFVCLCVCVCVCAGRKASALSPLTKPQQFNLEKKQQRAQPGR
jgi:hypothetical protein